MRDATSVQAVPALPLAGHALFRTGELDEAREKVGRVFCDHRLHTIGKGQLDACHHHVPNDRISLNYIQYGAKTHIAPGALESFYLLQVPLTAGAAIVNGGQRYASDPARAAVLNPHVETSMIWEEDCRQLLLRIDRQVLQDFAARYLGAPDDRPLTFFGPLDIAVPSGQRLLRLIRFLFAEAEAGGADTGTPLLDRHMEQALMGGLLEAQPHSHSEALRRVRSDLAPRHVRRAKAWLHDHVDEPVTVADVAAAVGVSARGLQQGFRRFLDTTPMAYLREIRLEGAHQDLLSARNDTTVTEIAQRWGMTHLGRFAQYYHARFGCTPQETLRNARNMHFTS